ncbi:uncharacterized protein PRCAT00005027001 [Priceomyces carsonii]|uniref:uncharacterized protein n=1 Tax=Priceomyces carsonii TaxID=28549 RepID=UPI002ED974EF|nr:unnamed protein product [Priceomyces carsonii]
MPSKELNKIALNPHRVRKVAIIGGGASGAIALDSLIKENTFQKIVLFERRDRFGGIWCLDENVEQQQVVPGSTSDIADPQLKNPFKEKENAGKRYINTEQPSQNRFIETPSYSNMKTNIIEKLMTYSDDNAWPVDGDRNTIDTTYVDRSIVEKYILKYISRNAFQENVDILTNTSVEDIERVFKSDLDRKSSSYLFKLTIRTTQEDLVDTWRQDVFDAIVVATGHYHVPYVPCVPGLGSIIEKFPSKVHHAKYFRNTDVYKDKTILIIGSRASGADLSKLIADKAYKVFQSIRSIENTKVISKKANVYQKPLINKFEVTSDDTIKVFFDDDSLLLNPDFIIYCTGYQFSFPFLNNLKGNGKVTKDGQIIPDLYQHTILIDEPLITFIGIPIDAVSFRVFEYQAILISRYLAGRIELPDVKEQRNWAEDRMQKKGATRAYHTIGAIEALEYINTLTRLGHLKESTIVGRKFPVLTLDDLTRYKAASELLRENWDSR